MDDVGVAADCLEGQSRLRRRLVQPRRGSVEPDDGPEGAIRDDERCRSATGYRARHCRGERLESLRGNLGSDPNPSRDDAGQAQQVAGQHVQAGAVNVHHVERNRPAVHGLEVATEPLGQAVGGSLPAKLLRRPEPAVCRLFGGHRVQRSRCRYVLSARSGRGGSRAGSLRLATDGTGSATAPIAPNVTGNWAPSSTSNAYLLSWREGLRPLPLTPRRGGRARRAPRARKDPAARYGEGTGARADATEADPG